LVPTARWSPSMLLEVAGLDVRYGRTLAVSQLSMNVAAGEIVTVLGANGAGKSSLLKALLGLTRPSGGKIMFAGKSIIGERVDERIRSGLVLVPEGRQILVSLTVHENLLLGAYTRSRSDSIDAEIDEIYQRFPNLASRRDMAASCLSGGEQQMLAIGRSLLARPRLLMLDEPSLGLSPLLVQRLFDLIIALNRDGLSILLVEQNTNKALAVAKRGYVLELGKVVFSGAADELSRGDKLRAAYLGQAAE
jgi:branched-chain amino acid transport system ATP-binding protein